MDITLHRNTFINDERCLRDSITVDIRKKIINGEWPAGSRIPSNEALAVAYQASPATVKKALIPLAREGFLERIRRLGTFVQADAPPVAYPQKKYPKGCVGILHYATPNKLHASGPFLHQLMMQIQRQLAEKGAPYRTWMIPFLSPDDLNPLDELAAAVKAGEMDRLIAVSIGGRVADGIDRLNIPVVFAGRGALPKNDPRVVDFDLRYFVEQALGTLVAHGKRRIGVISMMRHPDTLPCRGEPVRLSDRPRFNEGFRDAAIRFGVEFRPEWLRFPQKGDPLPFDPVANSSSHISYEQYGYLAFSELWKQKDRPDGLIVYPDIVARGVVMAMVDRKVRVPEEMQAVFHKNTGVDLYAPFPTTFLTSDIPQMATALLSMAHGEQEGPLWLPFQLQTHPGNPELRS